jgi:hypothetical protein
MGGDSEASNYAGSYILSYPKLYRAGEFLIGSAGPLRSLNLLQCAFRPPVPPAKGDLYPYFVNEFAPALSERFGDVAYPSEEQAQRLRLCGGLEILVGIRGKLYEISDHLDVVNCVWEYAAIGSGGYVAQGALGAAAKLEPRKRLEVALKMAERHSVGVKGRFRYLSAVS